MTEHYYSRLQNTESNPIYWDYQLRGKIFRFKTDNGVFSKKEVDFGSKILIETLQIPEMEGDILDAGCGYGPIGISIAKLAPERLVHMVDINNRALSLAEENCRLNKVDNIKIYESDRLLNIVHQQFALIVTNPPIRAGKKIVYDIFEQSFHALLPGGELWVVIQKKQGAPSALKKLASIFPKVETVDKKKGYYIIKAKK
ncbi:class I SAM-dependent methyltransferase [Bacillaceae bacterium Marseille-Q3522]|nr:class I SAM-dependent methyltransferase [Bacillaceae bacterium Marseille-Q3522]